MADLNVDSTQLVFTAFDVLKGQERELVRFDTHLADYDASVWDLSPDGTRIAVLERQDGRIHILSLDGQAPREIVAQGWQSLWSVSWAAGGAGLLALAQTRTGSAVLRVDLTGKARVLWEEKKGSTEWDAIFNDLLGIHSKPWIVPSPDGRHLAIYDSKLIANMWLMENF